MIDLSPWAALDAWLSRLNERSTVNDQHSASRSVEHLPPHLIDPPESTVRLRAIEEIVEVAEDASSHWPASDSPDVRDSLARIRELARLLHRLEPRPAGDWRIGDDPAKSNAVRAHAALLSLAAFPLSSGFDLTEADDFERVAADLICDLLHAVDRYAAPGVVGPRRVLECGWMHFAAEAAEEHAGGIG